MGRWVAGSADNITISVQLKLGLGLSLAILGKYNANIEQILTKIGQTMGNYFTNIERNIGQILYKYWANIVRILGTYANIGQIFD